MYKYNKSQLPPTFNDYFKLITAVHRSKLKVTLLHYQQHVPPLRK